MIERLIFICVAVIFTLNVCDGSKILGVVPTPAYSHQVAFQPIWRELSLRGHQVTVLTTNPMNDPTLTNLTEIDLGSSYKIWNEFIPLMANADSVYSFKLMEQMMIVMKELTDIQYSHPEVQNLLNNKTEHFDLLMVEFQTPSYWAFSHRFNCPYIGILSYGGTSQAFEAIGSPTHPVLYPDFMLGAYKNLTFSERLTSLFMVAFHKIFVHFFYFSKEELLIKQYFGDNYPSITQIMANIDMLFVNTDPIFGTVRPLTPNVIQIGGGTHRKPPKPLPIELQNLLDNARNGFIYFSLGSTVKSKIIPEKLRNTILETFAELPYTILWKFELDVLPNKPKNVYISKWVSQQDVLRHPNIKLFITQGGLQSLEEAIYNHVPFVGIPYFADQPMNMKNMVSKGLTVSLDRKNLTKEDFKNAILEVIENPIYRNKMIEMANLAQDEPMNGLEKAIWWTEYVLRHNGANHLRSPVLDIPSYQYYLLDVIGFLLFVTAIVVYLLRKIFTLVLRLAKMFFRSKKKLE